MKKRIIIVAISLIAGCGTGNNASTPIISSATTSTSTSTTSLTGKVADGYLVNATVFLDKNGNYQFDAGEPSTTTDSNGAYTLAVDPADVGKYPIIVQAYKGVTIDKDTGAAVTKSYVLSLHKDSVSGTVSNNFISPMSTQVREMVEAGTYTTIAQAKEAMRAKLALPAGTDVMADYMAANNTTMHTAAQNMATLMGNQMDQVLGANGSTTTVDVNRYRGMMGAIFNNISSVKVPNASMSTLMATMTTALSNIPAASTGAPFRNMSSVYNKGMMGGVNIKMGMMRK